MLPMSPQILHVEPSVTKTQFRSFGFIALKTLIN
jgi:hypothetical protein